MRYSRRQIMSLVPGAVVLGSQAYGAAPRRPRLAALTTIYFKYSHSQHIVDRFLEGYGWEGKHHQPNFDVVSLYVEQVGKNDLSRERVKRYPQMKLYPTIADALTQGGSELAVDGILLIGEHGDYPINEKGQKLYPRYEYFEQVVDVFRKSGRTAPVFSDKHLSWNWDWAKKMVATSRELGFGFMAGSSLPVSRRLPSRELPQDAVVTEAVAVADGGIDGGDIHIIEAMQSILERRRGGETGIRAVEAMRGDRFWRGLKAGTWKDGGWDRELMRSALSRCDTINPVRSGYGVVFPNLDDMRRLAPESYAYRFEYADGLKATVVQFQGRRGEKNTGIVGDRTIAARLQGGDIFSLLFYLPYYSMRNFFNPQVHHIETLFKTNQSPYPVERTLLTTGMTAAGIESLFQGQKRLETPHLAVRYQPTRESTFWRS